MITTPTPIHPGREPGQLVRIAIATHRATAARERFHIEIREAREQGHTLRAIAAAAGLSHEQVRKICSS